MAVPFFNVPMNLSHAATVAARVRGIVDDADGKLSLDRAEAICEALNACRVVEPSLDEAEPIKQVALQASLELVSMIELEGIGGDRLGQRVRNLFENLGEGQMGSLMGLRAGENPNSLQRPV